MAWTLSAALEAREGYIHQIVGQLTDKQQAFKRQVYQIKDLTTILQKERHLRSESSVQFFGKKDREWMLEILAAQGDFIARVTH